MISDSLTTYLATHDAPCPGCGYSLRALSSEVCPECGLRFSMDMLVAEPAKAKRNVFKVCITVCNIIPVAISALFVWLFAISMLGRDNLAAAAWAAVLAAHIALIWLLAMPIHRLIRRSSSWIALFNPLNIVLYVVFVDSMLSDLIGLPLA